ncbi:hypothetical protein A8F94_18115 [Bacillus sp. FJAT-27225]|nr:hypothetical protein A8F94_18115 [Bacillus sp. FJAT-27225]
MIDFKAGYTKYTKLFLFFVTIGTAKRFNRCWENVEKESFLQNFIEYSLKGGKIKEKTID